MTTLRNAAHYAAPVLSQYTPSAHRIQRDGLGYARPLTDDEIMRTAPAIYAAAAHDSGLTIKFTPVPGEPGAFDGHPVGTNLPAPANTARLMREAGDAYIAARARRQ